MADFDLSLVATFDTQQAEQGAKRVEDGIERMSAAEFRAMQRTKQSAQAEKAAASAEKERAAAIDAVRSAIEPNYAAQKRMNDLLAQAEKLHKSGAISLKQLEQVQKLHNAAAKGAASSARGARMAYTQLGFQIQDITQTLALGINPMTVFGQQAGQTAFAVSQMGGAVGKVGTFLAGPWGSIILGAITVLGLMGTSLLSRKKEAEDLGNALDFQRKSTEELSKAIREQVDEARKSVQTSYDSARATRDEANENLNAAIAIREKTKALLEAQEASRFLAAGDASSSQESAFIDSAQQAEERRLARRVAAQDANVEELKRLLRLSEIPNARREAEAANDAAAAATLRYEKAETALNKRFEDGLETVESYTRKLSNLGRTRDREIEAVREQERAQRKANGEAAKAAKLAEKEAAFASFALPFGRETITSGYGPRRAPIAGASTFHQGVDFGVAAGTPVGAPQVGVVESVGFSPSLGKYVILDHGGGTKTRYGHLSSIDVAKGDSLAQGQSLGRVGSTGRSTGPHLHYEVFVNGKRVDPTKGRFPIDDVKVAEAAEKARKSLEDFGSSAAESIARVTERFDEQPRLIDSAARAARELDKTIADLESKQPPGFEELIEQAQRAKGVIADSLLRPFEQILENSERRQQIDELIAADRADEAEALQIIWQLEERLGPLSRDRRRQILDTVIAERELTDELRQRQALQQDYLEATRSVRQEVEAILSGTGKLSNLKNIFRQLKGKILAEQLFGDVFRDLDKYVKENTAIKSSVDIMASETERAGESAGDFADTLDDAVRRLRESADGVSDAGGGSFDQFRKDFDRTFGREEESSTGSDGQEIVVTAIKSGVNGLTPERYFEEMTKRVVKPLLGGLDDIFGVDFFAKLEGVFGGAVNGYLTGGVPGGILGALKGIKGLPEGISKALDGALKGAQTGTMVAGIGNALGLKMSTTGSQIGGAIGAALPIPGGDILGSIAGGFFGKLIGGSKRGSAIVTSADGALGSYGNSSSRKDAAQGLGGAVQSGIKNIADALDAQLGAFKVSIGIRNDDFRVDTQGRGYTKSSLAGVRDFGDDEAAAISFAIADAIADGAIKGISPAVERALKSSTDIEEATREAIDVANLERSLKYMGDTIAEAFDDFRKVAAERVELAKKYGVDLKKVEELNAKERKQLLEDALERQVGSLKRLVDDLNFGSLFEGTATERRQKLLGEVEDAKQDVALGVDGAIDRLAELQRSLVETSRAAFGTAGGEYAADRDQALTTAQSIIEAEQRRIEDAAADRQKSLDLANETNDLLSGVNGRLDTLIGKFGLMPTEGLRLADFGAERESLVRY